MIKPIRPLIQIDTPLCDVPRDWLKYIEPKVYRGEAAGNCWTWLGRHESRQSYMIPTVRIPRNVYDVREGTKQVYAHRFVAEMFWNFPDDYIVHRTCDVLNCVNPNHFLITYRNDPETR